MCFFYLFCVQCSLCVVGLALTHVALQGEGGVTSVDFNVGKSDRSEFKVTGKRKKVMKLACVFCFIYSLNIRGVVSMYCIS